LQWFVEPLGAWLPAALVERLGALGTIAPVIEMTLAIGLLFPRVRSLAVAGVVVQHTLVLAMLGPFGHDWNSVIWPWNAAMMLLVPVLFAGDADAGPRTVVGKPLSVPRAMAAIAFCLLPAFGTIGLWDPYLSANLYSRSLPQAGIVLTAAARDGLAPGIRAYVNHDNVLWPPTWALDELNVPPYPAARVYRSVARALCRSSSVPSGILLVISSRPDRLTGVTSETAFTCDDL
jgi:hypothetical protein